MATYENPKKQPVNDVRQGERKKGMPSVLAISTVSVAIIFVIMLGVVMS